MRNTLGTKVFLLLFCTLAVLVFLVSSPTFAASASNLPRSATSSAKTATSKDNTTLLFSRDLTQANAYNFIAYYVNRGLQIGIPQESMILILFIPIMATIVVFFRYIIGFTTLGIAPTIVVAITFFVTGLTLGSILFATLLLAVSISRILFKKVRIMQLTKVSLSMMVVSILTIVALSVSLAFGLIKGSDISILPILLFMLLSERIVAIQLENSVSTAFGITFLTLLLGIGGFFAISTRFMKSILLVYPESLLLLIPINYFIGRYFGLRITEYFRFVPNISYGNK